MVATSTAGSVSAAQTELAGACMVVVPLNFTIASCSRASLLGVRAAKLEQVRRRQRHGPDGDALGVLDGGREARGSGDDSRLAGALDPEGVQRRWGFQVVDLDLPRYFADVRHEEIHERGVQQLA